MLTEESTAAQTTELGLLERLSPSRLDRRYQRLRLPQPARMKPLRASLERHGQLQPLLVNREDALCVLDGFKRLELASTLGFDTLTVQVVALSAPRACAALLSSNAAHRGLVQLEEAWVVRSLFREHDMRQDQIATLLGRHKTWVSRRLSLVERLESGVVEDMRLGLLSATVARELIRLPRGNQSRVAESIRLHQLSTRQSAEMISRYLETREEKARSVLLDDPRRYLAETAPKRMSFAPDPRLSQPAQSLRRGLLCLEQQAHAALRSLRWSEHAGLTEDEQVILAELAHRCEQSLQKLHPALEALAGAAHA